MDGWARERIDVGWVSGWTDERMDVRVGERVD